MYGVRTAANNWLSGTVPDVLRSLRNLTVLGLGTNFLHGAIPPWLGELRSLRSLNLGANQGGNPDGSLGEQAAVLQRIQVAILQDKCQQPV